MLYTSLVNWLSLLVILIPCWQLGGRARIMWLGATSLALLSFNDPVAGLLVSAVAGFALAAPALHRAIRGPCARRARTVIANSVVYGTLLLPLVLLKSASPRLLGGLGPSPDSPFALTRLALPLGLSYFTLRAVMYVRAVVRGEIPRQQPDMLICYFAFAPTASAGPIDTPNQFLSNAALRVRPCFDEIVYAGVRIATGVVLKFVIADNLQVPIATQFKASALAASPVHLMLFGPLYSVYLYAEFAGYSHMAIGAAALLGIESAENFARPLTRTNISDFWRSWHISLTSFLRTHVFLPTAYPASRLLGQRAASYGATVVTFVLCGVWHGFGWNYAAWGGYHALLLIVHQAYRQLTRNVRWASRVRRQRWYPGACWVLTFAAVGGGWLFFQFDWQELRVVFHCTE